MGTPRRRPGPGADRASRVPGAARPLAAAAIAVSGLHSPATRRPSYSRAASQRHARVGRRHCTVSQVLCAEGAGVAETIPTLRPLVVPGCGVLQRLAAKRSGWILTSRRRRRHGRAVVRSVHASERRHRAIAAPAVIASHCSQANCQGTPDSGGKHETQSCPVATVDQARRPRTRRPACRTDCVRGVLQGAARRTRSISGCSWFSCSAPSCAPIARSGRGVASTAAAPRHVWTGSRETGGR